MADRKHLLHVKSNVAETAKQYGIDDFLVTPKKPVDSTTGKATDDTLLYGEIAVNYGKGVEALTIRNTEDDIISFVNENDFHEAGEIISNAMAAEKMARETADSDLANDLQTLDMRLSPQVEQNTDDIATLQGQITTIESDLGSVSEGVSQVANDLQDLNLRLSPQVEQNSDDITTLQDQMSDKQIKDYVGRIGYDDITGEYSIDQATVTAVSDALRAGKHAYLGVRVDAITSDLMEVSVNTIGSMFTAYGNIKKATFTDYGEGFNLSVTDRFTYVSPMVNISYTELKARRTRHELKPGQLYRITDYVTTTTQENTQSAGHVFDVIVLATDVDTLNENAKVIKHEGDTYFANSNLDAWEIKYNLDNDITKYAWADETNGKGVIFYMKDEWNNECPYDFKNIQFKRWAVTDVQNNKLDSTTLEELKETFVYDNDDSKFITRYACINSNCYYGSTTHVVNGNDSDWYYTFSTIKFENEIYALNEIEDASIKGNNFYNDEGGGGCLGNSIKPYYDNVASDTDGIDGAQYLNNIVFNGHYETIEGHGYTYHCSANSIGYKSYNITFGEYCNANTFGNNCYYNTFGNHCVRNTFGDFCNSISFGHDCNENIFGFSCFSNTFGNNCSGNTFGNIYNHNTFGNNCYYNTFGNYCSGNTFGYRCSSNRFGNACGSNTFGDSCSSNTFGNICAINTFGEYCSNNTFGNDFNSNTFGNNCSGNTFGNGCYNNTFGEYCSNNTFGNDCVRNTFVNNCSGNTFGNDVKSVNFTKAYTINVIIEDGNGYIIITSTQETGSNKKLRNFTIAQGVWEGEAVMTISHDTVNDLFKTTYQAAGSKIVNPSI